MPKSCPYRSTCFLVLLPVSMVGLTFSYLGLGRIFLSKGGILGFGLVLLLRRRESIFDDTESGESKNKV